MGGSLWLNHAAHSCQSSPDSADGAHTGAHTDFGTAPRMTKPQGKLLHIPASIEAAGTEPAEDVHYRRTDRH
jgi:hypothetical protein